MSSETTQHEVRRGLVGEWGGDVIGGMLALLGYPWLKLASKGPDSWEVLAPNHG